MADPEKTPFGVTIQPSSPVSPPQAARTPTANRPPSLRLQPLADADTMAEPKSSPRSLAPSTPGHHDPANPFSSRFYAQPNSSSPAVEDMDNDFMKPPPAYPYDHDLETQSHLAGSGSTRSLAQTKDCSMWPSRQALKQKAREEKKAKSWNPLCRLGKRQKLAAQIVIAFVVIGAAVGIGVGVSRAVGGGVWAGQGQSKQIPNGGGKP